MRDVSAPQGLAHLKDAPVFPFKVLPRQRVLVQGHDPQSPWREGHWRSERHDIHVAVPGLVHGSKTGGEMHTKVTVQ